MAFGQGDEFFPIHIRKENQKQFAITGNVLKYTFTVALRPC